MSEKSPIAVFDAEELETLLESHFETYPDMEADDLLKLLVQAYRGPGHAVTDPRGAWDSLRLEARRVSDLEVKPWEEAVEMLRPEAGVARIHLRPYLRMGGDLDVLHRTFLRSAKSMAAIDTTAALRSAIAGTRTWLSEEALDVEFDERDFSRGAAEFLRAVRAGAAPPPHHSARYRNLYSPAYRVVALPFVDPTDT